tara:strand:+ start:170 stop:787 length:618 start_codon:yes stop_codon:yes gene_type:complete
MFLKLILVLLSTSLFGSTNEPRFGFYSEVNSGAISYNYVGQINDYSSDTLDFIYHHEIPYDTYKYYISNGFGINVIDFNQITSLGIRFGISYGDNGPLYHKGYSSNIQSGSILIHTSYGIYNLFKIGFIQDIINFKMLNYLSLSVQAHYERHLLFTRNYESNNFGLSTMLNYNGIGYLVPHIKYEKSLGFSKDNYSFGFSFYFNK